MDEEIILEADKVFRWEGPKRKQTLTSAKLGRLVLTSQRLLFLSTGKNDINLRRLAGGAVSPAAALKTGATAHLEFDAVETAGGLEIPVDRLRSAELTSMFKVLTIAWDEGDGGRTFSTFAPKNGGMPDGPRWVAALTEAMADDVGNGRSEPPAVVEPTPPAAPSRPASRPSGYLNPDRLASTVEELTARFGVAILGEPARLRNLLRDAYGADGTRERSDIDTLVSVLEQHPLEELQHGRSERDIAQQITRHTQVAEPAAIWTLSMIQRLGGTNSSEPTGLEPPVNLGSGGMSDATVIETVHPERAERRSRVPMLIAGCVVLVVAAGLVAWFAGRSQIDDWKQRALDAEEQLASADIGDADTNDDTAGVTLAPDVAVDTDDLESLQTAYRAASEQVSSLTAERDQLTQDVATVQASVDQLNASLSTATAELEAARAQSSQPFVTGAPQHQVGDIYGDGNLVDCTGFDASGCSPSYHLDARIVDNGTARYFEVPEVALIPITSANGLSWSGNAQVIGIGSHTCQGQPMTTVMTVDLHPAEYRADQASGSLTVIGYDVRFGWVNEGGGCTAAHRSYLGRFRFE